LLSFLKKLNTRLNKLSDIVSNRLSGVGDVDASTFNDEVALSAEWTALNKKGSSSIGSLKVKKISADRVELKGAVVSKFVLALIVMPWWCVWLFRDFELGLFLGLIGLYIAYMSFSPICFDRKRGYKDGWPWASDEENIALDEIHALQIIRGLSDGGPPPSGGMSSYITFELNLVSRTGARVAVSRLSKLQVIEDIAKELSEFLGVEVWNAVSSI
jgi:hypothetical protein